MASNQPALVLIKSGNKSRRKLFGLVSANTYAEIVDSLQALSIVANHGDYLACHATKADGSVDATVTFNVMKPWALRRTPFDGHTVDGISYTYSDDATRSATDGTNTETQKISAPYSSGDVIYAQAIQTPITVSGNPVAMIDVNVDGRAWAAL